MFLWKLLSKEKGVFIYLASVFLPLAFSAVFPYNQVDKIKDLRLPYGTQNVK